MFNGLASVFVACTSHTSRAPRFLGDDADGLASAFLWGLATGRCIAQGGFPLQAQSGDSRAFLNDSIVTKESLVMLRRASIALLSCLWFGALSVSPARAEVNVQTPWANVYVGPGGVYVYGPWGRVEVPAADRAQVCSEWRKNTTEYYEQRGCKVEFDEEGCLITNVECGK
jgi:hypothetical protein